LSAVIPFLSVQAGDTLTFEGNGRTIDGGRSGVATFADVTAQRMTGSGGKGGAGLGASRVYFIGGGGSATLDNVSVTGNHAIGGSGGTGFGPSSNYPKPGAGGTLNG
jgi:hypothetical protein